MAFWKRRGSSSEPPLGLPGARLIGPNLARVGPDKPHGPDTGVMRIVHFLLEAYNDEHGANAETVLSAAGALAGFAAQQAIWEGFVRPGQLAVAQAAHALSAEADGSDSYVMREFRAHYGGTCSPEFLATLACVGRKDVEPVQLVRDALGECTRARGPLSARVI